MRATEANSVHNSSKLYLISSRVCLLTILYLGEEGWVPTAAEAVEAGFVSKVVPHDELMKEAQQVAEGWIKDGKTRSFGPVLRTDETHEEYTAINATESIDLANAFLSEKFIDNQYNFANEKGKKEIARIFWWLKASRPLWSKLL